MANHDDFDRRLRDALAQRDRAAAAERERLARYEAEQQARDADWERQSAITHAATRHEREQTLNAAQRAARLLVHAATDTTVGMWQERKAGWRRQVARVPVALAEGWLVDMRTSGEYWVSRQHSEAAERYFTHVGILLLRDGGLVKFCESEGSQSRTATGSLNPLGESKAWYAVADAPRPITLDDVYVLDPEWTRPGLVGAYDESPIRDKLVGLVVRRALPDDLPR